MINKTRLYVINVYNKEGNFEGALMRNGRMSLTGDFRDFQFFSDKEKAKEFLKKVKKDIWYDADEKVRIFKIDLTVD